MNDGGVLGCENCKRRCCGYSGVQNKVITIFNGETGSNPTGDFVQEMELIDSKCKFLMDDGLCSIYLDPNRSVTCKFYPVVVDIYDNMYLSSTCPDYSKVIERLISGDKDTIEYFKKLYLDIIKVDPKIKDFWTDMVAEWPILICINPFISFNIQKIERKCLNPDCGNLISVNQYYQKLGWKIYCQKSCVTGPIFSRALSRGMGISRKVFHLKNKYPIHWNALSHIHMRLVDVFKVKYNNMECDFPLDFDGFSKFISEIGEVPVEMSKATTVSDSPTVDRIDNDRGYVVGNIQWMKWGDNVSKAVSNVEWSDERRKALSERNIDNHKLGVFSYDHLIGNSHRWGRV